ncbi:rod-binding protein [Acidimangrovimonas sediminis]|uniref:rod-binding protein n=1 Tax=Acidimangrovimonas sediminis TaxID=2056283 RepID=UPI001E30D805|nr:rod-binding protein [Acidimangrovimonas sediminis]
MTLSPLTMPALNGPDPTVAGFTSRGASPAPARSVPNDSRDAQLMKAARALETSFLSEMLGHAGLGAMEGSFGGGAGEEQFSSFLREAQAERIVAKGGIGLAEQIFHSLKERADGAS